MNNKNLFILFIALLVIYGISKMSGGKTDRSFDTQLINLDTASITRIVIHPKADDFAEVTLNRENGDWLITKGGITTKAINNVVTSVLAQLDSIGVNRIVAKKQDKWSEFEVNEGEGTRIQAYSNGVLLKDFILGRFSFNQQARTATSYIRLTDEDEVFAVDGFLSMTLGQSFDAYRNKEILKINKEDVNGLEYQISDYVMSFNKSNEGWRMNDNPVDSTKMDKLISSLTDLSGTTFADDFDPIQKSGTLQNTLTIRANNQLEPVILHCYADSTREKPFVIHSTFNKDSYFESDSAGVFKSIFTSVNEVLSN